jgi:DNA-binding response OmpR family regulator
MTTMKVLVAEDDATLREEVVELLRAGGHDVDAVADGNEAIRRLEAEPFDLALVDWNMPGKTGGEVLKKAREIRPRTAVIVMTGYGTVDTAVEAMRSGAKDFLQKPFEVDSLEKTIESIRDQLASGRKTATDEVTAHQRREIATQNAVKAAFFHSKQGLLVASKVRPGQKTGDEDLLVATLNVIQNFMTISFRMLEGKRLRSISQGDLTLATEAGKHLLLTVVIQGDDSEELRAEMREALKDFEESNRTLFRHWDGRVETPRGADETLMRLLKLSV